ADRSKLWFAVAVVLGLVGGRRGRRAAARGMVSIALASGLVNGPLKLLSGRARPPLLDEAPTSGLQRPPVTSSFPSGHTASAVAFATAAGAQVPEALPPLALLAGAVAYSRMHARVHYPSDVVDR